MSLEPGNHTVLEDRDGDLWVRYDEWPGGLFGDGPTWRHISGKGWDEWAQDKVGQARSWEQILDYEPLEKVGGERAAWALAKVREAHDAD